MKVKNWERFQHYKNRRPPWIKLYHDIIDDREFMSMPDASRALAPCIWVLASEYQSGSLPLDLGLFAFRFHSTEEKMYVAIKPLIEKGFLILEPEELGFARPLLAECKQLAMPETEERQRYISQNTTSGSAFKIPDSSEENQNRTPENLHPLNYAAKILEQLVIPATPINLKTISACIEVEIKSGKTPASAYEFILAGCQDARDEGYELTTFFFNDARYRSENRRNQNGNGRPEKKSYQQLRKERLDAVFAEAEAAERNGEDIQQGPGKGRS